MLLRLCICCCICCVLVLQLGDLELLLPPPPSSAAVVGFVLKFLAGYGNTLHSSAGSAARLADAAAEAGGEVVMASFGAEPQRDKALGMHRLVRPCWDVLLAVCSRDV